MSTVALVVISAIISICVLVVLFAKAFKVFMFLVLLAVIGFFIMNKSKK